MGPGFESPMVHQEIRPASDKLAGLFLLQENVFARIGGPQECQKFDAPSAGLQCRPLRAKGKVFTKIYRSFVILS